MMTIDPEKRPTAAQALEHPWIQMKVVDIVDIQATSNAFANLRQFRVRPLFTIIPIRQARSFSRQL
jgi:serine/threonine protein kinase